VAIGYGHDGKPDFWIADMNAGEAGGPNREVHVAFHAKNRDAVQSFYDSALNLGAESLHEPRLWPEYHPGYYGAFVRDPDGNSVEAVHRAKQRLDENRLGHVWIRVRDLVESRFFYETVAPTVGLRVHEGAANRFHVRGVDRSFAIVQDDPVTENVHLAFPADDRATIEEFHRAALEAGFRDNGAPGERSYHPGYYGAFVLDPDGNNIEAVFHDRKEAG
jgi:predicted lactoylglutathione lyase